jgi:hypothetical protein
MAFYGNGGLSTRANERHQQHRRCGEPRDHSLVRSVHAPKC